MKILAPQETLPPRVKGVFFMRPVAYRSVMLDSFQLSGDFDPVPVRIVYEQEEIVSRAMASRPPLEGNTMLGETIGPITNEVPFASFVAVMI